MGEYSKEIGERGEDIVEYLFKELLGYPHYRSNISIPCSYGSEHSPKKDKIKTTHGVDGLVSYKTPLENTCLEIGVISVKYTKDKYPNSPRSKFKNYFEDLAWTQQCFTLTDIKSEIERKSVNVDDTIITGVLFWLSDNEDSKDKDLLNDIAKSQFAGDGLKFDKIIFVDNSRMSFIYGVLQKFKDKYGSSNIDFIYPKTGRNLYPEHNENFGKQFPMDFFSYDILPLRIVDENKKIALFLICKKPYDKNELIQIVGLAKSFNQLEATSETVIGFPDYNKIDNSDEIKSVLMGLADSSFNSQINVMNYNTDFRNI